MTDAVPVPVSRTLRARLQERTPAADEPSPGEPRGIAYLYILPGVIVYATFVLFPFGHSVLLSFYEWDGITPGTWIGFGNYAELLTDPATRSAFAHSVVLILFYSGLPVLIGLLLAAAISRTRVRGLAWFRTVLFLPQVIPLVVVAVMWRYIYAPGAGPLNQGLRSIGLESWARPWLGDFTWALPSVGLVGTWVQYGLCMVLFIAGVQKIPTSLYDAARVDGAGPINEFMAVTLPHLRNEIAVALTLTIIASLRNFDLVYLTTNGGPGNATSVPAFEVYNRAFEVNRVGSAAAVGVALAIIIFAVTFLVNRIAERDAR
jgi:raffinose/stachyose/melibiose transport system permease protein